jgi:hypothetical protein
MPFDVPFPRSFTLASIQEFAPPSSGVYGISDARQWIYIGEADNIRETLLTFLTGNGLPLACQQGKGFVYELCERSQRLERHDRLVREYEPSCNRRAPQRRTG